MNLIRFPLGMAGVAASLLVCVSGQLAAQGQSASSAILEEVVVTARRREENLTDLPMSVVAINSDVMQAHGIYDIMDISDFVPNVNFTNTDRRGATAIFIRGIGSDFSSLRPVGAGVYLDGHYLPNTVGNMLNTVDVQRIEVLRGPQGTLFGKNTTGGAIQIITAKPHNDFEADVRARVGEFGAQSIRAMLNVPFGDTVAGRFSVADESSDGFFFNRTLNTDYGATDLQAFSGALRFSPNDNWMIDLSFRGNYQDEDNAGGQCRARPTQSQVDSLANLNVAPADAAAAAANHPAQFYSGPVFDDGVGQWGGRTRYPDGTRVNIGGHIERLFPGATIAMWEACNTDNAMGPYVVSSEKRGFLELDNENVNATVHWDSRGAVGAIENLNFRAIVSQHETNYNYLADRDYTPLPIDAVGTPPFDGRGQVRTTQSLELLLTADVSDRVSFVAGVHYFDDVTETGAGDCFNTWKANEAALTDPNGMFSIACSPDGGAQFELLADRQVPGGPGNAGMSGRTTTESIAAFAHVDIALNDNWTLDLGARWTDEDRGLRQVELETVGSTCTLTNPGDPPATSLCLPDYILSYESVIIDGFFNDTAANFSEVTPMVSLTRHLAGGGTLESGNIYFLIADGFLSGAFNDELNLTVQPALAPLVVFQPETVTNYEVGFKGTFGDGRLRLAADVFYMDYTDKQVGTFIDNTDGTFGDSPRIGLITNAATASVVGLEFEVRASPWDGGFLSFDFGALEQEYGTFTSFAPNEPLGFVDNSNLSIRDYAPDWTINASVEHTFALNNGATVTPLLGVYWQDDYEWITGIDQDSPDSYCHQNRYAKFRARVTYEPANSSWAASLYGSNINDERYFETCSRARSGVFDYRYGPPDQWGLEFNYRWGD